MAGHRTRSMAERFWEKVHRTDDCWLWTAALDAKGYGFFRGEPISTRAHRVAYTLTVGPIPKGLELDHLCRNRACVNPAHLEPVVHRENVLRGDAGLARARLESAKTHCPQGHPYDDINTYRRSTGHRTCRSCARERAAARRSLRSVA